MNVLGMRCSNKDYSIAVMTGTKKSPTVIFSDTVEFPKGYPKPQSLKWFLQEMSDLLKKYAIVRVVMKAFEGRTKGKTYETRVEYEAMVYLASANLGIKEVFKKVKSTIAKGLGLKGRGHYLATSLDTSPIPNYDQFPEKVQEATLAAWTELF